MSRRRGEVTDYAGEPLHVGDLINYSARRGNRVRAVDGVILRIKVERFKGRLIPFLLVKPTGASSGFTSRKTYDARWVHLEHVRLLIPNFAAQEGAP